MRLTAVLMVLWWSSLSLFYLCEFDQMFCSKFASVNAKCDAHGILEAELTGAHRLVHITATDVSNCLKTNIRTRKYRTLQ